MDQFIFTPILNLTLGQLLEEPIRFSTSLNEIAMRVIHDINIAFEIHNDAHMLLREKDLEQYHSMGNKQDFRYNPRWSQHTANLKITYNDFEDGAPEDYFTPRFSNIVNLFIQDFLAGFLGFVQRRRVIVYECQLLPSNSSWITFMGVTMGGEFIDSVGHGPLAISHIELSSAVPIAARIFLSKTAAEREQLIVILRRYNDVLNLPYSYERFDGYWRILESIGNASSMTPAQSNQYEQLLTSIGIGKSKNLKAFMQTLLHYGIPYNEQSVKKAFEYRNRSTHEYLKKTTIDDQNLPDNFHFVQQCADHLILILFGLDPQKLLPARHSIIVNRVL
jgi:hypothetical protein